MHGLTLFSKGFGARGTFDSVEGALHSPLRFIGYFTNDHLSAFAFHQSQ